MPRFRRVYGARAASISKWELHLLRWGVTAVNSAIEQTLNVELPILNPESSPRNQRYHWRSLFVHTCRVVLFLVVIFLIRKQHRELIESQLDATALKSLTVESVQEWLPGATVLASWDQRSGTRSVLSMEEEKIGAILQTAPIGNTAIGYLGPTNLLVVLSSDGRILDISILVSEDTVEHVTAVADSKDFLSAYKGLAWDFPDLWPDIDTVSGATLTSYAVKQAIRRRAGSQVNLSKFPNEVQASELLPFFPEHQSLNIENLSENPNLVFGPVYGNADGIVGYFLRTSPTANSLSGYQGPTDTLIGFDEQFRYLGSLIRSSYDNEPYVRYVKEDTYLDDLVRGKTIQEISDYDSSEYEGVSGATMTSLNVLSGIQTTARHLQKYNAGKGSNVNWSWILTECMTAMLGFAGIFLSWVGMKHRRKWRLAFQLILIVFLGFIAGEMLSQAVVVGWAKNGFPLANAPGMVFLCVSALTIPVISKHNTYCDHICPFGAVQQLTMKSGIEKVRLPKRLRRILKLIPAALLLITLLAATGCLDLNLASIEPFDAFSFRVAGWFTIAIALTGLVVSLFVPMGYCRYGCPTGSLLNFLRFNRKSHQIQLRDGFAILMLILALLITS